MNRHSQPDVPKSLLSRWWWRRLVFVRFEEETHTTHWRHHVPEFPNYGFSIEWNMWHRKDELTAFRFELLRRTTLSDLQEWHAVPVWLLTWVEGVISPKSERAVCGMFHPAPPKGYAALKGWMWDLTASDESLCRHFLGRINEERRECGLPDTRDPFYQFDRRKVSTREKRRGERNRAVSWLAVEAHDLQTFGVRALTDGERSRLSKARREIATLEGPFKTAVDHAIRFTDEDARNASTGNIYSKFIRENLELLLASRLPKE